MGILTTSSQRIVAGTSSYLAGTKTTRQAAIWAMPLLACLLASCSPVGSSTQQVIVEPTEPAVTETFEEPTETSTREPTATPTPTQGPSPTATEIPMYEGPLVQAEEYLRRGDPTIVEHNEFSFDWYEILILKGWLTLVSANPNIIDTDIVMEQVWGFNLNGQDYRFRINTALCMIYSPDEGELFTFFGEGMFGLIEGENYNVAFAGLFEDISEKYWQSTNGITGQPRMGESCRTVLQDMQTAQENMERVGRFLRSGDTEGLTADESGIYDLRGMITLFGTHGKKTGGYE